MIWAVLAVLVASYFVLAISYAKKTENNAYNAVSTELNQLFGNQSELSSAQSNLCQTTRNIVNWTGWTTCRHTDTSYYVFSGDREEAESTIYQLLDGNGWLVLDNGLSNNNGFNSIGYLDAVINKATEYENLNEFDLVAKIVDDNDVNVERDLNADIKQKISDYLDSDKEQVVRVGLSVVYRR